MLALVDLFALSTCFFLALFLIAKGILKIALEIVDDFFTVSAFYLFFMFLERMASESIMIWA